jgi:S1-C subfamily serine protease
MIQTLIRRASPPNRRHGVTLLVSLLAAGAILLLPPADARAATQEALEGVVGVTAIVPGNARTADTLGTRREGTGVVIDDSGLVVTIGYLIMEAAEVQIRGTGPEAVPASIVAYDHESGFGLVRAIRPLEVTPIDLGDAAALRSMQPLLVVSRAGSFEAAGVYLVDRREFAGYWEYLLEDALFTSPPHGQFGGAALIDEQGRLVGIGSLLVNDAARRDRPVPGNMFVPIDHLKPILGDLLTNGRRADPARPWLGLTLEEHRGHVFVTRVAPGGPAAAAGMQSDDLILGVGGEPVGGLAELYRKIWGLGEAGIDVPLDVVQGATVTPTTIKSSDRYRYLRLNPSY